jgi:hypothetical protein
MSVNQMRTREDFRRTKEDEQEKQKVTVARPKIRVRLIPIWLRIVLLAVMVVGCVIGGAMVGYGFLGDGNATDVLNKSTWTHIIDLIEKK